jgi:hypothetical protein
MPGKLNSPSALLAFTALARSFFQPKKFKGGSMRRLYLVICLIAAASLTVQAQDESRLQAQNCGSFETATGQPGWLLISGPGVTAPMVPANVTPYPGWALPLGGSSWVSVNATRGQGKPPGDYIYEYTFCVCMKDPALSLRFWADNGATVYLNSTPILPYTGNNSFNVPGPKVANYNGPAFTLGTNTLRIVVKDQGVVTGLDAVLAVKGAGKGCCRPLGPTMDRSSMAQ